MSKYDKEALNTALMEVAAVLIDKVHEIDSATFTESIKNYQKIVMQQIETEAAHDTFAQRLVIDQCMFEIKNSSNLTTPKFLRDCENFGIDYIEGMIDLFIGEDSLLYREPDVRADKVANVVSYYRDKANKLSTAMADLIENSGQSLKKELEDYLETYMQSLSMTYWDFRVTDPENDNAKFDLTPVSRMDIKSNQIRLNGYLHEIIDKFKITIHEDFTPFNQLITITDFLVEDANKQLKVILAEGGKIIGNDKSWYNVEDFQSERDDQLSKLKKWIDLQLPVNVE